MYQRYSTPQNKNNPVKRYLLSFLGFAAAVILGLLVVVFFRSSGVDTQVSIDVNQLTFDKSFSLAEQELVSQTINDQNVSVDSNATVHVNTSQSLDNIDLVLEALVPVTSVKSALQQVSLSELPSAKISVWYELDATVVTALADYIKVDLDLTESLDSFSTLKVDEIAFIPAKLLTFQVKLLALDDAYYLDTFNSGAVFREVVFSPGAGNFTKLQLNSLPTKDEVLKVNQTGVTALTRGMMQKLNILNDPLYFSKDIAPFLRDADITHVSNEVSFKDGCAYSTASFCSDPRFIETLKDSGVNLVELAGNHNNDTGRQNNKDTIDLYHSLGWHTIGGGLNTEEASKYYVADIKQSKVAFLAYNFADSPNGVAIATKDSAGANSFDFSRIETDIASAKKVADFVIVDVQYWECYSYPDGFVEFPICDKPIGAQEENFRKLVDLGADMVVGVQAHQPQTYETYKGKPIYYGLGNLYFDQIQWPGTERGIILGHYFYGGKLLQTRLSPTVYGKELQTHLMSNEDAVNFLSRLQLAR